MLKLKVHTENKVQATFGGDINILKTTCDWAKKWIDSEGALITDGNYTDSAGKFRKDITGYRVATLDIDKDTLDDIEELLLQITSNTVCVLKADFGVYTQKSTVPSVLFMQTLGHSLLLVAFIAFIALQASAAVDS